MRALLWRCREFGRKVPFYVTVFTEFTTHAYPAPIPPKLRTSPFSDTYIRSNEDERHSLRPSLKVTIQGKNAPSHPGQQTFWSISSRSTQPGHQHCPIHSESRSISNSPSAGVVGSTIVISDKEMLQPKWRPSSWVQVAITFNITASVRF